MRSHLLPLGLAVLFINPSFAQTADSRRTDAYPDNPVLQQADASIAPLTLDRALQRALNASPELSVAQRELAANEATILQAQARPNPVFSALLEDTRKETRTTTLQLNQPIETGGKRAARIGVAEQGRDAAAMELEARRADLRANVMAAFYGVLTAQERLRMAQASLDLAQRATGAATRRVAAGKVSPVEETRARVAEAGARIDLALAASELATAQRSLAATWGSMTPHVGGVAGSLDTLPPLPAQVELSRRLAASPGLQRARIEVERRQALTQLERSRAIPDVTVSFGGKRNEELGLNQAILGVAVPIPVFDRNRGNLLEAERRTDKARDELAAVEIRLARELAQARARLDNARSETAALQRDILPGAQSALDAATRGFELGKFSFLDVLDAQRTLFAARSQSLRALAEAYQSAAEIERILGDAAAPPTPASTPAPAAAQL